MKKEREVDLKEIAELIEESKRIVSIVPSDANESLLPTTYHIRTKLWEWASDLDFNMSNLEIEIAQLESNEIERLKWLGKPDTVVRHSKWNVAVDKKYDIVRFQLVKSRILTQITILWHWIDTIKTELARQARL